MTRSRPAAALALAAPWAGRLAGVEAQLVS